MCAHMNPFLSIVIPALNEEAYLPKLLDCLNKQKKRNFEVLVVDASTDEKTKRAVESKPYLFPFSYIHSRKQSPPHQRNVGARQAVGEYLVFIDADVTVPTQFTQKVESTIRSKKGLVFRPNMMPDDSKYPEINMLFAVWNTVAELSFFTDTPVGDGVCMIFERNFFLHIGCFDEEVELAEDHEIMRRTAMWGVRPRAINDANVYISLRRLKREGRIRLLYKYTYITLHSLFKVKIHKKHIDYDMGGRVIENADLSKDKMRLLRQALTTDWKKLLQDALKQITKL